MQTKENGHDQRGVCNIRLFEYVLKPQICLELFLKNTFFFLDNTDMSLIFFFSFLFYLEVEENFNAKEWKKLTAKELGIRTSMIAKPTRAVLRGLKEKGIVHFAFCFRFYARRELRMWWSFLC